MIDLSLAPSQKAERYRPEVSPSDPVEAFRSTLANHGLAVEHIDTSGSLVRVDIDKPGDKAGWYVFHLGEVSAGAFGNWRTGLNEKWCSKDRREMSDAESAEYARIAATSKAQREALKVELQAAARARAIEIWESAQETIGHEYLAKKGVPSHGLKQSRGALVVPLRDEKGELHNLQFIKVEGKKKRFLLGGRVEGLSFTIQGNSEFAICEGYATGATVHQATGATVVCAMNRGNLLPVAKVLRAACPHAQVTIFADNDRFRPGNPGITDATKAAKAIGAKLVFPVFDGLPGADDAELKLTDFNDLAAVGGIEMVRGQIISGQSKSNYFNDALFTVGCFKEIKTEPKVYHMHPWAWRAAYIVIAGEAGIGKSWFTMGALNAITKGESFGPWQCHEPAPSLYVEGEMTIHDDKERIDIMGINDERKEPFYILSDAYVCEVLQRPSINLGDTETRQFLREMIISKGIKVVVFDNIASLTPGMDENSKQEWDAVNQWMIGLRYAGVSAWLIHHLGKNGEQRGTSGRLDNVDMSIRLVKPNDYKDTDGCRFVFNVPKKRVDHALLPLISDTEMQYRPGENGRYEWVVSKGVAKRGASDESLQEMADHLLEMLSMDTTKYSKDELINRPKGLGVSKDMKREFPAFRRRVEMEMVIDALLKDRKLFEVEEHFPGAGKPRTILSTNPF